MMQAILLLGTNLNDRMQNLSLARKNIIERIGMIEAESGTTVLHHGETQNKMIF